MVQSAFERMVAGRSEETNTSVAKKKEKSKTEFEKLASGEAQQTSATTPSNSQSTSKKKSSGGGSSSSSSSSQASQPQQQVSQPVQQDVFKAKETYASYDTVKQQSQKANVLEVALAQKQAEERARQSSVQSSSGQSVEKYVTSSEQKGNVVVVKSTETPTYDRVLYDEKGNVKSYVSGNEVIQVGSKADTQEARTKANLKVSSVTLSQEVQAEYKPSVTIIGKQDTQVQQEKEQQEGYRTPDGLVNEFRPPSLFEKAKAKTGSFFSAVKEGFFKTTQAGENIRSDQPEKIAGSTIGLVGGLAATSGQPAKTIFSKSGAFLLEKAPKVYGFIKGGVNIFSKKEVAAPLLTFYAVGEGKKLSDINKQEGGLGVSRELQKEAIFFSQVSGAFKGFEESKALGVKNLFNKKLGKDVIVREIPEVPAVVRNEVSVDVRGRPVEQLQAMRVTTSTPQGSTSKGVIDFKLGEPQSIPKDVNYNYVGIEGQKRVDIFAGRRASVNVKSNLPAKTGELISSPTGSQASIIKPYQQAVPKGYFESLLSTKVTEAKATPSGVSFTEITPKEKNVFFKQTIVEDLKPIEKEVKVEVGESIIKKPFKETKVYEGTSKQFEDAFGVGSSGSSGVVNLKTGEIFLNKEAIANEPIANAFEETLFHEFGHKQIKGTKFKLSLDEPTLNKLSEKGIIEPLDYYSFSYPKEKISGEIGADILKSYSMGKDFSGFPKVESFAKKVYTESNIFKEGSIAKKTFKTGKEEYTRQGETLFSKEKQKGKIEVEQIQANVFGLQVEGKPYSAGYLEFAKGLKTGKTNVDIVEVPEQVSGVLRPQLAGKELKTYDFTGGQAKQLFVYDRTDVMLKKFGTTENPVAESVSIYQAPMMMGKTNEANKQEVNKKPSNNFNNEVVNPDGTVSILEPPVNKQEQKQESKQKLSSVNKPKEKNKAKTIFETENKGQDVIVRSVQIVEPKFYESTKPTEAVKSEVKFKPMFAVGSKEKAKQKDLFKPVTKPSDAVTPIQAVMPSQAIKPAQTQKPAQETKPDNRQEFKPSPNNLFNNIKIKELEKPKIPFLLKPSFEPKKKEGSFGVSVRRGGSFRELSQTFETEEKAKRFGMGVVGQSASASFKVVKSGKEANTFGTGYKVSPENFMPSKTEEGVIVELQNKRLKKSSVKERLQVQRGDKFSL